MTHAQVPDSLRAASVDGDVEVFRPVFFPRWFDLSTDRPIAGNAALRLTDGDAKEAEERRWPMPGLSLWDMALTTFDQARSANPKEEVRRPVMARARDVYALDADDGHPAFALCRTPLAVVECGGAGHCSLFGLPYGDSMTKAEAKRLKDLRDRLRRVFHLVLDEGGRDA